MAYLLKARTVEPEKQPLLSRVLSWKFGCEEKTYEVGVKWLPAWELLSWKSVCEEKAVRREPLFREDLNSETEE